MLFHEKERETRVLVNRVSVFEAVRDTIVLIE